MALLEIKAHHLEEIEWIHTEEVAMEIEIIGVAVMVGEIVHQTDEIIIAREADLDLLVEIVLVHRQIEEKEDRTNVLETVVHNQEEKGHSMKSTLETTP